MDAIAKLKPTSEHDSIINSGKNGIPRRSIEIQRCLSKQPSEQGKLALPGERKFDQDLNDIKFNQWKIVGAYIHQSGFVLQGMYSSRMHCSRCMGQYCCKKKFFGVR